ncbi:hypothetical protein ACEWBT_23810 [Vibrio parahaemolyticus]|nr:hypothetical protein [Vibrio parahaemolyticus]EME0896176.1 hypothetical protein [Vibrio parahaemolyticus]HBC3366351.1 hypothetical protein [Vibrio parahaemolyticus]HCM1460201.1 hypothetical protein [Vibrio parahaemolyticus]
MKEILDNAGIILGSGIFGSLITLLFTRYDKDKSIIIQNVTQERQKWREKIRDLVVEINENSIENNWQKVTEARAQLQVLINPYDENDKDIIDRIVTLEVNKDTSALLEINDSISRLLKHDWERVKKETTFFITAKGLMLAAITVAILGFVFTLTGYDFDGMTSLEMLFFVAFLFSIPNLYQLTLRVLLWLLNLTKVSAKSTPIIYWLMDKPYRCPMKDQSIKYEVTVKDGQDHALSHMVTVKKVS